MMVEELGLEQLERLSLWKLQGSHASYMAPLASFVVYPKERNRNQVTFYDLASEVTPNYCDHILLVEADVN